MDQNTRSPQDLLAMTGRTVEPPAGSFERVLALASRPQPRHAPTLGWLRPVMAGGLVAALLVTTLGGSAYASTPGQPLFEVQRMLDEIFLQLPRPAEEKFRVALSVADRRVKQASDAARSASPEVLRATLADAIRYMALARTAGAQTANEGQRRATSTVLGSFEREARKRLEAAQHEADDENDEVISEANATLKRDEERDEESGAKRTSEPSETPEPAKMPRSSETPEPSESPEPAGTPEPSEKTEPAGGASRDAQHSPSPSPAPRSAKPAEPDEDPD